MTMLAQVFAEATSSNKEGSPDMALAVKEPWQMTRAEFDKIYETRSKRRFSASLWAKLTLDERRTLVEEGRTYRRHTIEEAVRVGKPVPPEVLAEYPDFFPAAKPDMAVLGPAAWAELHAWAERFRSQVGDSCGCGEFAVMATRALHDLVNMRLGKKAFDIENLREVSKMYRLAAGMTDGPRILVGVAGHQRLPLGTPAQQERLERCIQEVKAKGGKANPWAVCQASLGCRHRRVVAQSGIEPWPEGMFDEEDEEEEEGDMEQEDLAIGGRVGKHGNVHPEFFPSEHAAQARKRELEAEPGSLPRHVEVHKWPAAWEPVEGVDSWVVVWWMESQPHLSQSFIDTILHTVVGTATATVVAKALNPGPSNIKEGEKPQDASPATPVPSVLSPAHVEGDQANVDLGTLLAELDAILKKPETMGIVDADTLTIVRE